MKIHLLEGPFFAPSIPIEGSAATASFWQMRRLKNTHDLVCRISILSVDCGSSYLSGRSNLFCNQFGLPSSILLPPIFFSAGHSWLDAPCILDKGLRRFHNSITTILGCPAGFHDSAGRLTKSPHEEVFNNGGWTCVQQRVTHNLLKGLDHG